MTTAVDWSPVAKRFEGQAMACALDNASPTSAAILRGCAAALQGPHMLRDLLLPCEDHTPNAAVPLRLLGALHRVALDGRAPDLAAVMPSCGGKADPSQAWAAAERVLAAEPAFVAGYLTRPPQTNEIGRSAALFGGFLAVAAATGLPLRLLEIGASAGLNLFWDRYRVSTSLFTWGPDASTVELPSAWTGPLPNLGAPVDIVERAACDVTPIDIRDPEGVRRMESYIWTDQVHRLDRLRAAARIAQTTPFTLDAADAADWAATRLAEPRPGLATVLFHSIMWQYMRPETAATVAAVIAAAGARATKAAPLAWLSLEPSDLRSFPRVSLTLWPGGVQQTLGTAHFHGAWVKWGSAVETW